MLTDSELKLIHRKRDEEKNKQEFDKAIAKTNAKRSDSNGSQVSLLDIDLDDMMLDIKGIQKKDKKQLKSKKSRKGENKNQIKRDTSSSLEQIDSCKK